MTYHVCGDAASEKMGSSVFAEISAEVTLAAAASYATVFCQDFFDWTVVVFAALDLLTVVAMTFGVSSLTIFCEVHDPSALL